MLCSSLEDGILIPVDVSSSTVSNGSVKGGTGACEDGVVVDGSSNRLISLTETGANEYGFNITGDLNSLLAVSGNDNRFYGLVANGSFNTVRLGTFAFNADGGARFDYGTRNAITRSTTFDNRVGIAASSGATNTTVMLNTSSDNSTAGYFLGGGSTGSILFLNKASFNGVGIWISSLSNHNSVITIGSYLNGLDMQDGNANCDTNLWASNVFTTANQSCIG